MIREAHIVLGAGFGDEGKGALVNDLVQQSPSNTLVIRFNGGNQAGHTVTTPETSHVFSHFGAGVLQGAPTFWSKYALFEPATLVSEKKILDEKLKTRLGFLSRFFADRMSPVITPYDIEVNRQQSHGRNNSCGLGIGMTIQRNIDGIKLYVNDLFGPKWHLEQKLEAVTYYYRNRYNFNFIRHKEMLQIFFDAVAEMKFFVEPVNNLIAALSLTRSEQLIFEGAQGILLDEDFGYAPEVTWSKTTSKNAVALLRGTPHSYEMHRHYVSRAYLTRHGSGPFPSVQDAAYEAPIKNPNETNIFNKHQGDFRIAPLNAQLLDHAIMCDQIENSNVSNDTLHITCMDQCPNFQFVHQDKLLTNQTVRELYWKLNNNASIKERNHP